MVVPEPATTQVYDYYSIVWTRIFPLLIIAMYILPVFTTVSLIVKEKESRAKESMRMMGMTDFPYWMSWFVYYTLLNTVICLIAWGILFINVIGFSNPWYILLCIWLYGQAIFGEIILMQSLFSKSKFAGTISAVIYFTLVFFNIPLSIDTNPVSKELKFYLSLIP